MKRKYYICIDPGVNGAVACGWSGDATSIEVFDSPNFEVTKQGRKTPRPVTNPKGMFDLLESLRADKDDVLVVLEQVHARERDSTVSAFTFGENYGVWRGALSALSLPVRLITPQVWKRKVFGQGRVSGEDAKERARQKCIELLPHLSQQLKYKKDHNRAEAALLCYYAINWLDKDPTTGS